MTEQDFNKKMQKMFFRLEKNIGLVRNNYINNFGGSQITNFLFAMQEICELMSDDYENENNSIKTPLNGDKCPKCESGIIQVTPLTPPDDGIAIGCNKCAFSQV